MESGLASGVERGGMRRGYCRACRREVGAIVDSVLWRGGGGFFVSYSPRGRDTTYPPESKAVDRGLREVHAGRKL